MFLCICQKLIKKGFEGIIGKSYYRETISLSLNLPPPH